MRNIVKAVLDIQEGKRVRMGLDDLVKLEEYACNVEDESLYRTLGRMASDDVAIGTFPVYEVYLKPTQA